MRSYLLPLDSSISIQARRAPHYSFSELDWAVAHYAGTFRVILSFRIGSRRSVPCSCSSCCGSGGCSSCACSWSFSCSWLVIEWMRTVPRFPNSLIERKEGSTDILCNINSRNLSEFTPLLLMARGPRFLPFCSFSALWKSLFIDNRVNNQGYSSSTLCKTSERKSWSCLA